MPDTQDFSAVLAGLYDKPESANALLEQTRLATQLLPAWSQGMAALDFWQAIDKELDKGIDKDGKAQIVEVALEKYKENEGLQRLSATLPKIARAIDAVKSDGPPFHYVPPYSLETPFFGRLEELDELDAWARSGDPLQVVEAIGGMGKSALAWHWLHHRATASVDGLAGVVWWSFYEGGATLREWVRGTLARLTGVEAKTLDSVAVEEHLETLCELLRARPYLFVLDGFERVLAAYHHLDAARARDDQVETELRDCTDPRDGDTLRRLLACGPSKFLMTTRLLPRAFENRAHRPVDGVRHRELGGLASPDALALLRELGVEGDERTILDFTEKFGNHGLLLGVVAGRVADYMPAPGDFGRWLTDPDEGGSLRLGELDLKQRRTHILHYALRGLAPQAQTLLSRMAIFSGAVAYENLKIFNPFASPDTPAPADAEHRFRETLRDLRDRRLTHWDGARKRWDLHPLVRGFAYDRLEGDERVWAADRARDHFEAMPPENTEAATELGQVERTLEIFRLLVAAERWDKAFGLYQNRLSHTLFFSIAAYPAIGQLLLPFFPQGIEGAPCLESKREQSRLLNDLALAWSSMGRHREALALQERTVELDLGARDWSNLSTGLGNQAHELGRLGRFAAERRTLELGKQLAELAELAEDFTLFELALLAHFTSIGAWDAADDAQARIAARPKLTLRAIYLPGDGELVACWLDFLQDQLDPAALDAALEIAVRGRNTFARINFLHLRAELALRGDTPRAALESIQDAVTRARRSGMELGAYLGCLARVQARLGLRAEALRTLDLGATALDTAEVHLELGNLDAAREPALRAYERAWAEGPPYVWWWQLQRARRVLEALGVAEPELPPFDPAKVEKIPYEDEIRRVIEELRAQRKE